MYEHNGKKYISLGTVLASVVVVACVMFIAGLEYSAHSSAEATVAAGAPAGVDFSPVWKAWRVINEKFVPAAVASTTPVATSTEAADQQKVWGLIDGLAASLGDPYTFFLPPTENQTFSDDMNGSFEGVGMEIAVKSEVLTVVSPLKGTPADKAGIKSGDQILKINGDSTQGLDVEAAVKKIRGPKGSIVTVSVMREGFAAPKDFKVVRDVINVPTVISTPRTDGVFVIQLTTFTANSPDLFRGALRQFVDSHDTKLVLDLRGNPGGYLDAAVDMASWFLPTGKIVVTEDYAGHQQNIVHRSFGYDVFNSNLKMVILVDEGSASASEILADALHHYGIGQLVGTHTFGKGSVQELVNITPETALKVTVARWLGPDGIQIPKNGILPDVKVDDATDAQKAAGKDPQLDKAVQILKNE